MSTGFDPLYQWLGIPPEEQPPHHYRLLGIGLFEGNPDVIESAADRQMAYLRTFYGGPYSSYAQGLLNEIAAARVCLLNRENKAEYDAWLRQQIMPPVPAPEPPLSHEPEVGDLQEVLSDASQYAPPRPRAGRKGPWLGIAALLAAVLVGGGILALALFQAKEEAAREGILVIQWPEDERLRGVLELDGRKVRTPLDGPIEFRVSVGSHQVAFTRPGYDPYQETVLVEPGTKHAVRPVWREISSDTGEAKDANKAAWDYSQETKFGRPGAKGKLAPEKDAKKTDAEKGPSDEDAKLEAAMGAALQSTRQPIPDEAAQKKARKTVRDLYKADFDAAKNQADRQAMAKKLLHEALGMDNDPVGQYVLLDTARAIALESGDGLTAFSCVEEMAQRYRVPAVELKVHILESFAKRAKTLEEHKSVAEYALPVADQAMSEGNLALATELGQVAVKAALKGRDKEMLERVRTQAKQYEEVAAAYTEVEKATATLAKNPKDPEANFTVGKYQCLIRGDWDAGLPMLAQGSDADLKAIARRELERVSVAEAQAALGDQWLALAMKNKGLAKRQMQARAVFWYRKALPGLSDPVKGTVEKRLKELAGGQERKEPGGEK
jgi:hypothetical protein